MVDVPAVDLTWPEEVAEAVAVAVEEGEADAEDRICGQNSAPKIWSSFFLAGD